MRSAAFLRIIPDKEKIVWVSCSNSWTVPCFPIVALRCVFGSRVRVVLGVLLACFFATAIDAWRSWRGVPRAFGRSRVYQPTTG